MNLIPSFETARYVAAMSDSMAFSILFVLVLLLGATKCFFLMVRPKASGLCMLSLALFLIAMALSATSTVLHTGLEGSEAIRAVVTGGLSMVAGLLLISAIALAIIGLVLYRKPGNDYEQGRKQAVTVLVIFSVMVISAVVGAAYTAATSSSKLSSQESLYAENEELNFRVKMPSGRWGKLDPEIHNPAASVIYRAVRPELWFMLIAEQAGMSANITTEALTEISKSNITTQPGSFEITDKVMETINGIDFSVFETAATGLEGTTSRLAYRHYVSSHQGYCYQLVFFSEYSKRKQLYEAASEIAGSFVQIDPEKILQTTGEPIAPMTSEESGFSVDLTDLGWTEYDETAGPFPEADFAATTGGYLSSGITYLDLNGLNPDNDALRAAFLAAGFGADEETSFDGRREITNGVASGEAFHFRKTADEGTFTYHFRLLRHEDHVWFISGWGNESVGNASETLETVLDQYKVFEPIPPETLTVPPDERVAAMAEITNQIGLAYYRRDDYHNGALFFQRALETNPEDGQIFENAVHSLTYSDQPDAALTLLDEKGEKFSSNTNLAILRALNLNAMEKAEAASEAYSAAFAAGHSDLDDLLDYLNVLVDLEQQEQAIKVIDTFDERHPGNHYRITRWKSSLLQQIDQYDEAISLLQRLLEKQPDYRLRIDVIKAELDAERYSDAITSITEMEDSGTRNGELLFLKGRSQFGLESYRDAKSNLEAALKLSPDDDVIKDYLEHASTMLGKGSVADIQNKIEAIPLPSTVSELADRLESTHQGNLDRSYGSVILRSISGRQLKTDEPVKSTFESSIKITDSKGLDQFSTLKFSFDPHIESIYVNEVRVADENGKTVITANIEDFFIVDETDDELATTEKNVHVPVPGLKVGQVLHYRVTREYHSKNSDLEFIDRPMDSTLPTVGKIFYVVGDLEAIKHDAKHGVEVFEFEDGLAFYTDGPRTRESESMQPWLQQFSPWLTLSGNSLTWKDEGLDYLDRLESLLGEPSRDIVEIATSAIAGAKTEQEKISALCDYVTSSLTYQGIEFGPRGQIPNSASKVIENRYGDCKDHSLLLTQLLRASGVEAFLALVSTNSPIQSAMPTLEQFDHMIVYAPGATSPFIDPTVDHFPHGLLQPESLVHEKGLILDPENIRLEVIEPLDRPGNIFTSNRTVRVEPADPSRIFVNEVVTLDGYPANWFRDYLADLRQPERIEKLTSVLRSCGEPVLTDLETIGLDQNRVPLVMKMSYTVPRPLSQRRNRQSLEVPTVWEQYFIKFSKFNDRKNPFEILIASEFSSQCRVIAPESMIIDPETIKLFTFEADDEFASWDLTAILPEDRKSLTVKSDFLRKKGTYPASEFEDFINSVNLGLEVFQQELTLSPDQN